MYSCVFWCEFIDLVGFLGCYCLNPVTLFIIRSKGSTEKQPGIRSQIFSTRGKLLSSLHRSKRFKPKYLHACCWKWTFPRATGSKISSFSRRCEKRHLDTGRWLRGQISLDRGWLSRSIKKTPQETFPVIQLLSILKYFVYCCHSDIDFT